MRDRIPGKLVSLISGGIDSPVAAYRMMKRGLLASAPSYEDIVRGK